MLKSAGLLSLTIPLVFASLVGCAYHDRDMEEAQKTIMTVEEAKRKGIGPGRRAALTPAGTTPRAPLTGGG